MKKIFVLFILSTILFSFSGIAIGETVVPIYVTNYEIASTLESEEIYHPIYRKIDSEVPITSTIKELINLKLTDKEKEMGFESGFEKADKLELKGVNLVDGLLTIELIDPEFFTSGGSQRVTVLRKQFEKTVLQFDKVDQIKYTPNYIFQP